MLAIIIPYYKLTFFEATLASLVSQTNSNFKVYIGDDASLESPCTVLEKFHDKLNLSYHRYDDNLGGTSLVQQWERCISLSENEEWLMILGDDDRLGKNVVEEFYNNLSEIQQNRINVVRFATQSFNFIKDYKSEIYIHERYEKASDFYYRRYLGHTRSSLSEHIFRRERYLECSFREYPLAWHSDDYAWIDFAANTPILSINNAVVTINVSQESITGKETNLKQKKVAESMFYMDLIREQLHKFKKHERLALLMQAEVSIKKIRKPSLEDWYILFSKYLRNYNTLSFLKLIRRFVKHVFKR